MTPDTSLSSMMVQTQNALLLALYALLSSNDNSSGHAIGSDKLNKYASLVDMTSTYIEERERKTKVETRS